jgi:hypothetical protein
MVFDDTGDLLANDPDLVNRIASADTFELPNPQPSNFPLPCCPLGMAINDLDHHWFVADASNNDAAEYLYPSGKLVGTVPGIPEGEMIGIAVDP